MPNGLTKNLAKIVAEKIVEGTKDSKKTPVENWTFIVESIFQAFKDEGIIVVDQLDQITIAQGLIPSTPGTPLVLTPIGPPVGSITSPSTINLKGKIT